MAIISSTAVGASLLKLADLPRLTVDAATYYFASALSDWGMPTWKFIFSAGSQLHGADGPFLWGPAEGELHFKIAPSLVLTPTHRSKQCHDRRGPQRLLSRLRHQQRPEQHLELRHGQAAMAAVSSPGIQRVHDPRLQLYNDRDKP